MPRRRRPTSRPAPAELLWLPFPRLPSSWFGGASIAVAVGVLAVCARRLLGLRVGLARALLAGVVGFLVWSGFGYLQESDNAHLPLLGVAFGIGILASAGFLVLAEAVLPAGAGRGPFQLYLALLAWMSRTRRYGQVLRIGVRHGLWPYLRGRRQARRSPELARSLRLALEEAGPTFVKLGQFLSTRHDLLPPPFVEELRLLQARVAPAPWDEVEQVIAAELGGSRGPCSPTSTPTLSPPPPLPRCMQLA